MTTTELTGVCPDTHKGGGNRWMAVLRTTSPKGRIIRYLPLYPAMFPDRAHALVYAQANLEALLSEANLDRRPDNWLVERARPLPQLPAKI